MCNNIRKKVNKFYNGGKLKSLRIPKFLNSGIIGYLLSLGYSVPTVNLMLNNYIKANGKNFNELDFLQLFGGTSFDDYQGYLQSKNQLSSQPGPISTPNPTVSSPNLQLNPLADTTILAPTIGVTVGLSPSVSADMRLKFKNKNGSFNLGAYDTYLLLLNGTFDAGEEEEDLSFVDDLQPQKLNRQLKADLARVLSQTTAVVSDPSSLGVSGLMAASHELVLNLELANRKANAGAKADSFFDSIGLGGGAGWKGAAANVAVGAVNAVDDLTMGDKNFGALSEAIDLAVHGVSGALMLSGSPWGIAAGAILEGANFLTKAGGETVQGFDVDINSSGYGQMGHMESKSNRNFAAALGPLGFIGAKRRLKRLDAQLAKRNEQARMALEAADIADSLKFEQEARMDSISNVVRNNQAALAGGIELGSLGA